jgi:hypothetical protein
MPENLVSSVADETDATRRQRDQIAHLLAAYEGAKASGVSQRDVADSQGIPRSRTRPIYFTFSASWCGPPPGRWPSSTVRPRKRLPKLNRS